jgi:phospholipid transport system substrate-binding protein
MKPILLLLCALLAGSGAQANDLGDPADMLQAVGDEITASLSENMEQYRADPDLLKDLVERDLLPVMDTRYSARLILGRAGRDASEEQIAAFGEAMSRLLIDRYASGLLEYREREQIEVLPTRGEPNPRLTKVRTRVRMLNGKHIPVDYACRHTDEGWKVFDVIVEGISYVTTYRNQIKPQVEDIGIDGVIDRLAAGQLDLVD